MLKKSCFTTLALLLASNAFAQSATTTTTTYSSPVTITASNGCTITGITSLTYDGSQNITTNGAASTCNSGGTPPQVATVQLAISPTSYTLGSGAAAPVVTVTNLTAAAAVTCTLNPTNGFTASPGSVPGTGSFTLSSPTTAGTFSFAPTCTTTTSGYTVSVSPQAVSLTVNSNPNTGGGNTGPCSATQTSSLLGSKTLQRQCTGDVYIWPGPAGTWSGALTDLGQALGGTSFPSFQYSGYSPTFNVQSGSYVAMQFTPSKTGAFQLVANPSYGDGGIVTLSTAPGSLTQGSPGYICGLARGAANSLYVGTNATACPVTQGVTYFVNFADADLSGNALCFGGKANTCSSSTISYTIYTSN